MLQQAGYRTAHFGKWHIGDGPEAPEVAEYGFDETRILCQGKGPRFGVPSNHPRGTAMLVDETISFIEQSRNQPFFVNVWTFDVHAALNPSQESLDRYKHLMSQNEFKTAMQIYYAAVTEMDLQLGRLIDAVDGMGLAQDTLIVFSSDNGPEDIYIAHAGHHGVGLPGPFRGRKRSLYEGGIREPFILRWKGHTPENIIDDETVLSAVDLLPTFCSLAGVELPGDFSCDGEDMADVFTGKGRRRRSTLFWEWRFDGVGQHLNRSPMLAIREGDWKLLFNPDGSRVELYDIPRQPMELHSQAEKRPEIVARLREKALEWQKSLPQGPATENPGSDRYYMGHEKPPPKVKVDSDIFIPQEVLGLAELYPDCAEEIMENFSKMRTARLGRPVRIKVTRLDVEND
jgi:N-acetylgalactosamine-6-sulfatase